MYDQHQQVLTLEPRFVAIMNRRKYGLFYRNYGSSELWVLSELRVVGIGDRRNCGSSELWIVGLMGRRNNGSFFRNYGSSELWADPNFVRLQKRILIT